jgi:hypothetical protein
MTSTQIAARKNAEINSRKASCPVSHDAVEERGEPTASKRGRSDPAAETVEGGGYADAPPPTDTEIDWKIWNPAPHKTKPTVVIDQAGNTVPMPEAEPPPPEPKPRKTLTERQARGVAMILAAGRTIQ